MKYTENGIQYHIGLKQGDVGKYVILPGDPGRCKEIAKYLNHEYMFKYLDDKKFLYDIEEITEKNFCAATYFGITGGNQLLKSLNMGIFGLEHTGQIGDAILSTFY